LAVTGEGAAGGAPGGLGVETPDGRGGDGVDGAVCAKPVAGAEVPGRPGTFVAPPGAAAVVVVVPAPPGAGDMTIVAAGAPVPAAAEVPDEHSPSDHEHGMLLVDAAAHAPLLKKAQRWLTQLPTDACHTHPEAALQPTAAECAWQ
jgi:hypothetical protein